jgi:hypothetical protein
VPGELTLDRLTRAGQKQADGKVPGGRQGAVDDRPRRVIAPHGVHGNAVGDTRGGRFVHRPDTDADALQLLFVDGPDLPALVIPARCAHAVRRLGLLALRALARAGLDERVVRTTLAAPGLGVTAFRIRHLCRSSARAP